MTDHKRGVDPEVLKAGHETAEVSARPVTLFLVGLTIGIVLVFLSMLGLFRFFAKQEDRANPPMTALEAGRGERLPPEPRLQVLPKEHYLDYRQEQDHLLSTYGWVDRDSGLVRLPIEKALRIAADRGFPARSDRAIEPTLRMNPPTPPVEPVPAPETKSGTSSGGHH